MVLSSALCFAAATGHAADAVSSVGFLLIVAALPALVVAGLITWVIGRVAPPPPPIQATRT
jgi:hypothetical protein